MAYFCLDKSMATKMFLNMNTYFGLIMSTSVQECVCVYKSQSGTYLLF